MKPQRITLYDPARWRINHAYRNASRRLGQMLADITCRPVVLVDEAGDTLTTIHPRKGPRRCPAIPLTARVLRVSTTDSGRLRIVERSGISAGQATATFSTATTSPMPTLNSATRN